MLGGGEHGGRPGQLVRGRGLRRAGGTRGCGGGGGGGRRWSDLLRGRHGGRQKQAGVLPAPQSGPHGHPGTGVRQHHFAPGIAGASPPQLQLGARLLHHRRREQGIGVVVGVHVRVEPEGWPQEMLLHEHHVHRVSGTEGNGENSISKKESLSIRWPGTVTREELLQWMVARNCYKCGTDSVKRVLTGNHTSLVWRGNPRSRSLLKNKYIPLPMAKMFYVKIIWQMPFGVLFSIPDNKNVSFPVVPWRHRHRRCLSACAIRVRHFGKVAQQSQYFLPISQFMIIC